MQVVSTDTKFVASNIQEYAIISSIQVVYFIIASMQ